jgi:hypothetical protein
MPISTSSREKSTSPVLVLMRTSISGLARWKPPSRGTTHFMANDAVVVTVRCPPLSFCSSFSVASFSWSKAPRTEGR